MFNSNEQKQSYEHHPVEDIEPEEIPENVYREGCARLLISLGKALLFILNSRNKTIAVYQIAYAYGVEIICQGRGMTEIAEYLTANGFQITRAAISKEAVNFCKINGLPPSTYMKEESFREAQRKSKTK